jgi:hypothetical protein
MVIFHSYVCLPEGNDFKGPHMAGRKTHDIIATIPMTDSIQETTKKGKNRRLSSMKNRSPGFYGEILWIPSGKPT